MAISTSPVKLDLTSSYMNTIKYNDDESNLPTKQLLKPLILRYIFTKSNFAFCWCCRKMALILELHHCLTEGFIHLAVDNNRNFEVSPLKFPHVSPLNFLLTISVRSQALISALVLLF